MELPSGLRYSKEHEWVKVEGEVVLIGITDFAQAELGDVVYVELPEVGAEIEAHNTFGVVESVKAVSDLYAPVSGVITEVNNALEDEPELVNSGPYEEGWMIRVELKDESELNDLLDADSYRSVIEEESV